MLGQQAVGIAQIAMEMTLRVQRRLWLLGGGKSFRPKLRVTFGRLISSLARLSVSEPGQAHLCVPQ
jgi:hypothetical protein